MNKDTKEILVNIDEKVNMFVDGVLYGKKNKGGVM